MIRLCVNIGRDLLVWVPQSFPISAAAQVFLKWGEEEEEEAVLKYKRSTHGPTN